MQEPVRHLPNVISDASRSDRSKLKWQYHWRYAICQGEQSLRDPQRSRVLRVVHARQLAAYAGKRSISVFQLLVSIPAAPSVRVAAVATYAATTYAGRTSEMKRTFRGGFDSIRMISKTPGNAGKIKAEYRNSIRGNALIALLSVIIVHLEEKRNLQVNFFIVMRMLIVLPRGKRRTLVVIFNY